MSQPLESTFQATVNRLNRLIDLHRDHADVSFSSHVRAKRRERVAWLGAKELIYLDTMVWKCMADYRQNNPKLTPAMVRFGRALENVAPKNKFIFPIGLPTYFELDSMTHTETRNAVTALADELSQGLCITPFQERVGSELLQLRQNNFSSPSDLSDFLCSPMELLGIPKISLASFVSEHVDEETFNKAFFDSISELPFSTQMQVTSAAPGQKWNNSSGISDLNIGKSEHQEAVVNLNSGIFLELKGCIATWFEHEGVVISQKDVGLYALEAQHHWCQVPDSRALPTLRILSSLYGLMRFDSQRRYHDGDPNDFMVAASALPVANALFTDRKLSNLLSDSRIGLSNFSNCEVVSGFDEMADYLTRRL